MDEVFWIGQEDFTELTIDGLRSGLARVPEIVRQETGVTDLPFPLNLIEGITEEDVNLIYEASGRLGTKYVARWETFKNVNLRFVKEGRQKQATKILNRMKVFTDKGVPSAPLLLIPARTFLLLREENQGWITQIAEQAEKEVEEDPREKKDRKEREKDKKELKRLWDRDRITEKTYQTAIKEIEREGRSVKDILKHYGTYTYHDEGIPDFVYWAREKIGKLVSHVRGYTRPLDKLFKEWEIPVNSNSFKVWKHRRTT